MPERTRKGVSYSSTEAGPADSVWDGIIDDYVAMDCDDWVNDMRMRRHDIWLRQGELDLKAAKPAEKRKRSTKADASEEDRPAKKPRKSATLRKKVVVQIFKDKSAMTPEPGNDVEREDVDLLTPPSSQDVHSRSSKARRLADQVLIDALETPPETPPGTPSSRVRYWRSDNPEDTPSRSKMSPQRPNSSPLSRSFKPLRDISNSVSVASPNRPEHSPIKASPSKHNMRNVEHKPSKFRIVSLVVDEDFEVSESDGDNCASKSQRLLQDWEASASNVLSTAPESESIEMDKENDPGGGVVRWARRYLRMSDI